MEILGYEFLNPEYLIGLVLLPLMAVWQVLFKNKRMPSLHIGGLEGVPNTANKSVKIVLLRVMPFVRIPLLGLLIIALARPQKSASSENISTEGIDMVVSLDVSTSMLAMDFKPNRLEAAKKTALSFIKDRYNDRIGFVIFAGESFTVCPATTDHAVLMNQIAQVNTGNLEDGTAIGMGLATSADRLRTSNAKSKVIILLTDGVNNSGLIDPQTATDIALRYGIRVYTIGVGSYGTALYPTPQGAMPMPVEIDEALMQKVSKTTGGKYFRATDNKALQRIFAEIDKMEKTKIEVSSFHQKTEVFYPLAIAGLVILLLELLLRNTILKTIP